MKKIIGWLPIVAGTALIIWALVDVYLLMTAKSQTIGKEQDPIVRELPKIVAGGLAIVIGYFFK